MHQLQKDIWWSLPSLVTICPPQAFSFSNPFIGTLSLLWVQGAFCVILLLLFSFHSSLICLAQHTQICLCSS